VSRMLHHSREDGHTKHLQWLFLRVYGITLPFFFCAKRNIIDNKKVGDKEIKKGQKRKED
jgi:hypothetical protein